MNKQPLHPKLIVDLADIREAEEVVRKANTELSALKNIYLQQHARFKPGDKIIWNHQKGIIISRTFAGRDIFYRANKINEHKQKTEIPLTPTSRAEYEFKPQKSWTPETFNQIEHNP